MGFMNALKKPIQSIGKTVGKAPGMSALGGAVNKAPGMQPMGRALGIGPSPNQLTKGVGGAMVRPPQIAGPPQAMPDVPSGGMMKPDVMGPAPDMGAYRQADMTAGNDMSWMDQPGAIAQEQPPMMPPQATGIGPSPRMMNPQQMRPQMMGRARGMMR